MKQKEEIKRTIAEQANGLPILGHLVWWTVHKVEIPRLDLEDLLAKTVGIQYMPTEHRKAKALKRGLESMREAGLLDLIRDDKVMTAYQITDKMIDVKEVKADYRRKAAVQFVKRGDGVPMGGEIRVYGDVDRKEVQERLDHYLQVYTADDIRMILKAYVRDNAGINLNENGLLYFVPEPEVVDVMKVFLEAVGGDLGLSPVTDTEYVKTNMVTRIRDELEAEIESAAEEVKRMSSSKFTRGLTFKARLKEFAALKNRCETYSELLKLDAETMIQKVSELQESVEDSLMGIHVDYPQMKEFPYGTRVRYTGDAPKLLINLNGSTTGTVIGYLNSKTGKQYVKVRFDTKDIKVIRPIAPGNLEITERAVETDLTEMDEDQLLARFEVSPGWYQIPGHTKKVRKAEAVQLLKA